MGVTLFAVFGGAATGSFGCLHRKFFPPAFADREEPLRPGLAAIGGGLFQGFFPGFCAGGGSGNGSGF